MEIFQQMKILIIILLLINNIYCQESIFFINSTGKNIHDANRIAMNAARAHNLQVTGSRTQINPDGSAFISIQVKPKKQHRPDQYAPDDRIKK